MKIPEILKGQEALPYMEFAAPLIKRELRWWASDYKGFGAVGSGAKWVEKQQDYYCDFTPRPDLAEAHAFLSSDFKPEMIGELFSGWNWSPDDEWYEKGQDAIDTGHIMIYIKSDWVDCQPWKTLNDFLSDCKRAGITLTYKE